MKPYIFLLIAGLAIAGCKSRKVATEITRLKQQIDSAHTRKQITSSLDTSQKHLEKTQTVNDSSAVKVSIETDSGTISDLLVNPDGSLHFNGKAKRINVSGKRQRNDQQQKKADLKSGVATKLKQFENVALKKKVDSSKKNKHIESTIDWGKTLELICVIIFVIIAVFMFIRLRLNGFKGLWQKITGIV